jgi:hypothetical protein
MIRFVKRGDSDKWLEYYGGSWTIKPAGSKGIYNCWAYIKCDKRLPENCASGSWQVCIESKWVTCSGVSVVMEVEFDQPNELYNVVV